MVPAPPDLTGKWTVPCQFVCLQNAALFWWNLHRSGEGDGDTLHAGCPVLVGDKWGKAGLPGVVGLGCPEERDDKVDGNSYRPSRPKATLSLWR